MSETRFKLAELLPSWRLALEAQHLAPGTIASYTASVQGFLRWCDDNDHPAELDRRTVRAYLASLHAAGAAVATGYSKQAGLKRFSKWLAEEGERDADELATLTLPKLEVKPVVPLTEGQLRALVKACHGNGFRDRRDEAMVRLLAETGIRAGELIGLRLSDVDLSRGIATIRRGKGGKGRVVPFGASTAATIDRYLRARRAHRLAATERLWLGDRGRTLGYPGLNHSLRRRADAAGIAGFHLHILRNTAATRWLAAGGSEGGLMSVAGWSGRTMLDRYVAATAADRATEEARRLALGEL